MREANAEKNNVVFAYTELNFTHSSKVLILFNSWQNILTIETQFRLSNSNNYATTRVKEITFFSFILDSDV